MKVWHKIMVAPAVTVLFLIVLGGLSYGVLTQQHNSLNDVVKNRFGAYQISASAAQELSEVHSNVYRLITWISNLKEDKIKQLTDEQKIKIDSISKILSEFSKKGNINVEEQKLAQDIVKKLGKYKEDITNSIDLSTVDISTGAGMMQTADDLFQVVLKELKDLVEIEKKLAQSSYDSADAIFNQAVIALISILILAITASMAVSFYMSIIIVKPLKVAIKTAGKIADGDLTDDVVVEGNDETGQLLQALHDMTSNLRNLVGEVATGSNMVADTSSQIAQGNLELSQRTEEQAGTLEETSSSMEELTATVNQNTDNAKKATGLAINASDIAKKGGVVVGEVVSTMNGIYESSKKISDIIGVIDSIAFQTNILALNAAVEAARAGEQGRGFAVVAAEVRNLAQRSAEAAKEIKGLIANSGDKVNAGTKLVGTAGKTMDEIVHAVKQVSDLIAEIAASSQEQSDGINQVNTAIVQMDQVVQKNATLVEEATAATESMKEQAGNLRSIVSKFKLLDNHTK